MTTQDFCGASAACCPKCGHDPCTCKFVCEDPKPHDPHTVVYVAGDPGNAHLHYENCEGRAFPAPQAWERLGGTVTEATYAVWTTTVDLPHPLNLAYMAWYDATMEMLSRASKADLFEQVVSFMKSDIDLSPDEIDHYTSHPAGY